MTGRHRVPDPVPASGVDPSEVDSVPGDPPVPITVWRTAEDPGEHATPVPSRLAQRLVAAYSSPGEIVIDLTAAATLAAATRDTGRHHRPATFTHTTPPSITLGPITPTTPATDPDDDTTPADDHPPGDHRSGRHRRTTTPTDPHDDGARTGLLVACWPLHQEPADSTARLEVLLPVAAGLLRPGGCLVLLTTDPGPTPPQTGPAVVAAAAAGLGYLQHIVAVRAAVDGDTFTYYADPTDLAALTTQDGGPRHRRAHTDLIVFLRGGRRADA